MQFFLRVSEICTLIARFWTNLDFRHLLILVFYSEAPKSELVQISAHYVAFCFRHCIGPNLKKFERETASETGHSLPVQNPD